MMDTTKEIGVGGHVSKGHVSGWMLVIIIMLASIGCGGEHKNMGSAPHYEAGSVSQEEIERQLKHDARVQDFEVSGDKLIVNVNQAWIASPPGLQQRAAGQWFGMWQAAQNKKSVEVLIRHEGNDIARWNGETGYKHVAAPKSGEEKEGSSS
jgi:hypothetical protein